MGVYFYRTKPHQQILVEIMYAQTYTGKSPSKTRSHKPKVEAIADVFNVPALGWLLRPCVPLVSLTLVSCCVPPSLLRGLLQVRDTLRCLVCHGLPRRGLDAALLEVTSGCGQMRYFVFFGFVRSETVKAIAAMEQQ
jgi:hypothetical protein